MPFMNYYLIAHNLPLGGEPMDEPLVVATMTTDPRVCGRINPHKELERLAGKLGLVDFEITTADARDLPGAQLGLPFPARLRSVKQEHR